MPLHHTKPRCESEIRGFESWAVKLESFARLFESHAISFESNDRNLFQGADTLRRLVPNVSATDDDLDPVMSCPISRTPSACSGRIARMNALTIMPMRTECP